MGFLDLLFGTNQRKEAVFSKPKKMTAHQAITSGKLHPDTVLFMCNDEMYQLREGYSDNEYLVYKAEHGAASYPIRDEVEDLDFTNARQLTKEEWISLFERVNEVSSKDRVGSIGDTVAALAYQTNKAIAFLIADNHFENCKIGSTYHFYLKDGRCAAINKTEMVVRERDRHYAFFGLLSSRRGTVYWFSGLNFRSDITRLHIQDLGYEGLYNFWTNPRLVREPITRDGVPKEYLDRVKQYDLEMIRKQQNRLKEEVAAVFDHQTILNDILEKQGLEKTNYITRVEEFFTFIQTATEYRHVLEFNHYLHEVHKPGNRSFIQDIIDGEIEL